jgi:DNA-binding Lrp family transcriptional regulator
LIRVVDALATIPEVLQAHGLSGPADLLVAVVCQDANHLFRIDTQILAIEGIEPTETSLSMGEIIPFRIMPLIERVRTESSPRMRVLTPRLRGVT